MPDYRAVVYAGGGEEVDGGEHLNKVVSATNFANLLTKTDVTNAVSDVRSRHGAGTTAVVTAWEPHASAGHDDAGDAEELIGNHLYIVTDLEFYSNAGDKLTTIAPIVKVGQALGDAVYDGFSKVYVTSQAIQLGISQTLTVSDNITGGFNVALASTSETIQINRDDGSGQWREVTAYEIEVNAGAAGRTAGTRVQGNVTAAAVATATTTTGTDTTYAFTAKSETLAVDFTVQAA